MAPRSRTGRSRDLPDLLRRRRRPGGQRHAGHPGAALRRAPAWRGGGPDRGDAAQARGRRAAGGPSCDPAKKLAVGEHVTFGGRGGRRSRPRCSAKEAGEVVLRFDRGGRRRSMRRIEAVGRPPLPPYIEARRAERRGRRRRLSDHVRGAARRRRGADRRPAFHAGAARPASRRAVSRSTASRCMSGPAPSCR